MNVDRAALAAPCIKVGVFAAFAEVAAQFHSRPKLAGTFCLTGCLASLSGRQRRSHQQLIAPGNLVMLDVTPDILIYNVITVRLPAGVSRSAGSSFYLNWCDDMFHPIDWR